MKVVRGLLALAGVAIAVTGVYKLFGEGWSSIAEVVQWLIVGNLLHDALLAPTVGLLGVLLILVSPAWARMPVVTGFLVLGSVTLMAVPVLGNFGNEPSNPSLMNRDYWAGWWAVAGSTVLGVGAGCWWQRRRLQRKDERARRADDHPSSAPNDLSAAGGRVPE